MSSPFIDPRSVGLPLDGIVVVDLTMALAGPVATKVMADMGACVIKIEGLTHYDMSRGPVDREDFRPYAKDWPHGFAFNRSGWFHKYNRNKFGVTLDLKSDEGREIFLRLIPHVDALVENFSARVMDSLGFSYAALSALNPKLVQVSLPAFGLTGPERDYVGFGSALEMLAGFVALRGYLGGGPMRSGINFVDPIAGLVAATATMAGLLSARRTGVGQHLDVSQLESGVSMLGEFFLDWTVNGRLSEPLENRSTCFAPQGAYQCRGDDQWVALSVTSDEQWRSFAAKLGLAKYGMSEEWNLDERRTQHDAIDLAINAVLGKLSAEAAVELLREVGVPVSKVNANKGIFADRQLQHRGFFQTVDHPDSGPRAHPSSPWLTDRRRIPIRRPAARLGQDNHLVFGEWLGIDTEKLRDLESKVVIGEYPLVDVWGDRDNRDRVRPKRE